MADSQTAVADALMPLPLARRHVTRSASEFLIVAVGIVSLQCREPGPIAPHEEAIETLPLKGIVISNPHTPVASFASVNAPSSAVEGEIVYVSLAPKTLPAAVRAQINNRTRSRPGPSVHILDGGFDPVAVEAAAGDTLEIISWTAEGRPETLAVRVTPRRPPSVVRSRPPRGLTDVALNVIIGVIFTEPVDPTTVNGSTLQLLHNGTVVAGRIVLAPNSWSVEFVPAANLEPNDAYQLIVSKEIRDFDGDALDESFSASFMTGTSLCDGTTASAGCLIFPIEGNNVVSGSVTERTATGQRPVANAAISVWVQLSDGSGYPLGPIRSDANGKYTITSLPATAIQLHANVAGLDQWCGVVTWPSQPGVIANIELHASGSAAQRDWGMTLAGFVYELVGASRQPIPAASISFESRPNVVAATATSDVDGNFILCSLPAFGQQMISITKPGYEPGFVPVNIFGGQYAMTASLTRLPP